MDQPGLVAPASYPSRDFRNASRENGLIDNPPSFTDIGGLSGPGKYPKRDGLKVEKPTSSRPAKKVAEKLSGF